MLKKKSILVLAAVIVLALGTFASWYFLKPADCSTYEGLQHALEQRFFVVKDVTEQVKQEKEKNRSDYLKVYENQHYLDVNGVQLDVIIAKPETVDSVLKEKIEEDSRCDRLYQRLLFKKGNLILSGADMNKRLTKALKDLYGESLVN